MPLIEVTLAEGRTPEQIRAMMHEVHEAVLRTVDTRARAHPRHRPRGAPNPLGHGDLTLPRWTPQNRQPIG